MSSSPSNLSLSPNLSAAPAAVVEPHTPTISRRPSLSDHEYEEVLPGQQLEESSPQSMHDSPPSLPSPTSLHELGISPLHSPLSPLMPRRSRTSVPPSYAGSTITDDEYEDERTQNIKDKDVLVERLTDLVERLSAHGPTWRHGRDGETLLHEDDVNALHAKVDEIEKVLSAAGQRGRRCLPGPSSLPPLGSPEVLADDAGGAGHQGNGPSHEVSEIPPRERVQGQGAGQENALGGSKPSTALASQLNAEAEKLCAELNGVLASLQARREESEHLHEMLLDRAQGAAERILELETEITRLKEQVVSNEAAMRAHEADLRSLGLQLKAIEALCDTVVPSDMDPELLQSIRNWRRDWASLKRTMSARKAARNGLDQRDMSFSTFTSP